MVVIYKGEDTQFANLRQIVFTINADQISLTGWTARFFFMGIDKCIDTAAVASKSFTVEYTTDETREMPLGMNYGTLHFYDSDGKHAQAAKVQINVVFNPTVCGVSANNQISVSANNVFVDYNQTSNKPKLNGVTIEGEHDSAYYNILSTEGLEEEIARAQSAEAALGTRITNEATTRSEADTTNANAIAAEKTRAEGVEAGKQDTISDLETIRTGAASGATALQPESSLDATKLTGTISSDRLPLATGSAKGAVNPSVKTSDQTEEVGVDAATGKLYVKQTSDVVWGNISGDIGDQDDLQLALEGKVDVVSGKGLSTNDFTTSEKNKLSGIEEGAQVNPSDYSTVRSNASAGKTAKDTIDGYGNIVTHNTSEFATSGQGSLADSALQPSDVQNVLTSTATNKPLSAKMGKTLNDNLAELSDTVETKQDIITSSAKLSSDLVDDSGHSNKFITDSQAAAIQANSAKVSCTDSTVGGFGYTKNEGTVTSVSASDGLEISGTSSVTPTVGVASTHKLPTTTEWGEKQDRISIATGSIVKSTGTGTFTGATADSDYAKTKIFDGGNFITSDGRVRRWGIEAASGVTSAGGALIPYWDATSNRWVLSSTGAQISINGTGLGDASKCWTKTETESSTTLVFYGAGFGSEYENTRLYEATVTSEIAGWLPVIPKYGLVVNEGQLLKMGSDGFLRPVDVNGILKNSSTDGVSAATAGTDYIAPSAIANMQTTTNLVPSSDSTTSDDNTHYPSTSRMAAKISGDVTHAKSVSVNNGGVIASVIDSNGDLDVSALFGSGNTSLTGTIDGRTPYALGTTALETGGQLVDRTINLCTCGETAKTLTLPPRVSGLARDFIIRFTVPSTLTNVGGIALSGISAWEGDALSFEKGTADKVYLVTVTETANSATAPADSPTLFIKVIEAEAQSSSASSNS